MSTIDIGIAAPVASTISASNTRTYTPARAFTALKMPVQDDAFYVGSVKIEPLKAEAVVTEPEPAPEAEPVTAY
jgi:hypothetical protein